MRLLDIVTFAITVASGQPNPPNLLPTPEKTAPQVQHTEWSVTINTDQGVPIPMVQVTIPLDAQTH